MPEMLNYSSKRRFQEYPAFNCWYIFFSVNVVGFLPIIYVKYQLNSIGCQFQYGIELIFNINNSS
jgi:hypothetical protein